MRLPVIKLKIIYQTVHGIHDLNWHWWHKQIFEVIRIMNSSRNSRTLVEKMIMIWFLNIWPWDPANPLSSLLSLPMLTSNSFATSYQRKELTDISPLCPWTFQCLSAMWEDSHLSPSQWPGGCRGRTRVWFPGWFSVFYSDLKMINTLVTVSALQRRKCDVRKGRNGSISVITQVMYGLYALERLLCSQMWKSWVLRLSTSR